MKTIGMAIAIAVALLVVGILIRVQPANAANAAIGCVVSGPRVIDAAEPWVLDGPTASTVFSKVYVSTVGSHCFIYPESSSTCYVVDGIGTNRVTVVRNPINQCAEIHHVDGRYKHTFIPMLWNMIRR